ncbi:MAG: glycoside hydrolase family 130 protein [Candidatus Hydrogenedentes bacterium]|nr:glycoside hydrolase family 130 protein [Candidatus Hydrogenedentota bacterium]
MKFTRFDENPLIVPEQVQPSAPDREVMCSFNAGVTEFNGEILLLMRVAERPIQEPGWVSTFVTDWHESPAATKVVRFKEDDPKLDMRDPRVFRYGDEFYLSSLSHQRIARSVDGRTFTIDTEPALIPRDWYEEFGIEDAHITEIGGTYYITAVGVSSLGISTVLYSTTDFVEFNRHGILFPCDNRDVVLFPEKIDGDFTVLHRPMSTLGTHPAIWTARSPDLINWGRHKLVVNPRPGMWDSRRVGASTVPFRTARGWLDIYHGATESDDYCLGAVILDSNDPTRVVSRTEHPILQPETPYETEGLISNVVFSCGCTVRDGIVLIYYGAGDRMIAGAEMPLDDLLDAL